jgi:heavy metal sensor kinase
LTLWYTFSLGLILLLFTVFLYFQIRGSLIDQVDAALNLAANQALINVNNVDGELAFQALAQTPDAIRHLQDDFLIHLLATDGTVVDTLSREDESPVFFELTAGFQTQDDGTDLWRIYRQAIRIGDQPGWIQVSQELEPVIITLNSLRRQIILGIPLALILAGIGGYFLASRALRPIDDITQTAQVITATDLDQRLQYQGPADEVGRLAQTFDTMLDRLQAAFVRERRFTADAAHELRTPLTALKGRIDVTLSRSRAPATYQKTLHEMEGQVDRLIGLNNDLLFIARLDQARFRLQMEEIALAELLGTVIDLMRPLATNKAITLNENVPDGLAIQGDFDLLMRLFVNLFDNAIKFTPKNGLVSVRGEAQPNHVEVTVSDTGPGIADEHLPNLFKRFYRVEDDRARSSDGDGSGGAGLGLAIADEIARLHGGQLYVESQPGQGTSIIFRLPSMPGPAASSVSPSS